MVEWSFVMHGHQVSKDEVPLPRLSDMEWEVLETNPDELLEFFWHIARQEADAKRRGKGGCIIGDPPGLLTLDDLFS